MIDDRAQVLELLDRAGAAWWRAVFDEIEVLARQGWCTSGVQIAVELRSKSITVRGFGASVLVAACEDAHPPRVQLRTFGARGGKSVTDFNFAVDAAGRLRAGRHALDPAGVAQRALALLLATARPEQTTRSRGGTPDA